MNALIDQVEAKYLKKDLTPFRVGDFVRVDVKVVEGESERVQAFEGVVIRRRGHGIAATFTVRKVSFGIGIERTFPMHSPRIEGIEVLRSGKVRRAKLYYLRNLSGKAARIAGKEETQDLSPAVPAAPAAPASAPEASKPSAG